MDRADVLPGSPELAEPALEQLVRSVEVAAEAPDRGRPVLTGERLLARGAEELPVDADQEPRRDARVTLVDVQLGLDRVRQRLHDPRHHLELLRLTRLRLLDDAGERRE